MFVTYWQVFASCVAAALACLGLGWAAGYVHRGWSCHWRHARHTHAAAGAALVPLPELPAADTAALELRHANVMARTVPREIPPLARAAIALAAIRTAVAATTVAAAIAARFAEDRSGARPWLDATDTMTILGDLDRDEAAA